MVLLITKQILTNYKKVAILYNLFFNNLVLVVIHRATNQQPLGLWPLGVVTANRRRMT